MNYEYAFCTNKLNEGYALERDFVENKVLYTIIMDY